MDRIRRYGRQIHMCVGGGRSLENHAGRIMGYINIEIACSGINLVAVDVAI